MEVLRWGSYRRDCDFLTEFLTKDDSRSVCVEVAGNQQNVADAAPLQLVIEHHGLIAGRVCLLLDRNEQARREPLGNRVRDGELGFIATVDRRGSADEDDWDVAVLRQLCGLHDALAGPVA